ncbi:MAG: hypothetical protein EBE86_015720 [Hormoscilla sp. GUM202]|nr:hypothetical protein [Hormoscilla sp. GUM202]
MSSSSSPFVIPDFIDIRIGDAQTGIETVRLEYQSKSKCDGLKTYALDLEHNEILVSREQILIFISKELESGWEVLPYLPIVNAKKSPNQMKIIGLQIQLSENNGNQNLKLEKLKKQDYELKLELE